MVADSTPEPTGSLTPLWRRWRAELAAALGLPAQTFWPASAAAPLDGTDAGLWACLDTLPRGVATFDPAGAGSPRFSAEYAALAARLELSSGSLEQAVGPDVYTAWVEHRAERSPAPERVSEAFRDWAAANAPEALAAGLSAFSEAAFFAEAANATAEESAAGAEFVGGYEALRETLAAAASCSLAFEYAAAEVPVAGEAGTDGGPRGLWPGDEEAERLGRLFAAGRVRVRASFGSCLVWVSVPGPWYSSSLMGLAYGTTDVPPWRPGPGREEFFGPGGRLAHLVAALAVADAVRFELSSDAPFDEEDRRLIGANAGRGLWPLYLPDGDTSATRVSFDAAGQLSAEVTSVPGRPLVLGANVLDAGVYLGRTPAPS